MKLSSEKLEELTRGYNTPKDFTVSSSPGGGKRSRNPIKFGVNNIINQYVII
jgi:hypothetical protein